MKKILITLLASGISFSALHAQSFKTYDKTNSTLNVSKIEALSLGKNSDIWMNDAWDSVSVFNGTSFTRHYSPGYANDILFENNTIWVAGAYAGLSKYDGVNWTYLTPTNSNLPSMEIQDFALDSKGNIWMATHDSGILKFDKNSTFTTFKKSNSTVGYINFKAIAIDVKDTIWAGAEDVIIKFDGVNTVKYDVTKVKGFVRDIKISPSGSLYISTNAGISIYNHKTWSYLTTADGLPSNDVWGLAFDHNGDLWAATDLGTAHYNGSKWEVFTSATGLGNSSSILVLEDKKNQYIIGTVGGFTIYNPTPLAFASVENEAKTSVYPNPFQDKLQFNTELESVIITDLSGNIIASEKSVSEINTSNFAAGIYLVSTQDKGISSHYKVVKK